MFNENFLSTFSEKIVNRSCDYLRFSFQQNIKQFSEYLASLDDDNNSTTYFLIQDIMISATKFRTPRGYALLMATSYEERSIPLFFYEEYNDSTIQNFGYTSRFDVYSSALRYFYLAGLTLPDITTFLLGFLPSVYIITRFDIAVDVRFDFRDDIIQNPDNLFKMRIDTKRNIIKMPFTYYVGNKAGVTRFYRVYDKTNDIKKNHKEFLYPDLLDSPITRIECQYGSKYKESSVESLLKNHFYNELLGESLWFVTPVVPSKEKVVLSFDESLRRAIPKALKYGLDKKTILKTFERVLDEYLEN